MDSTIRGIVGGEDEEESPEVPELKAETGIEPGGAPEDTETEELANLWTTGNKGEVIRRYMDMDNEKSVKLVFAIGYEGALELARMVDQMIEQGEFPGDEESTEPERVEPPAESDAVRNILGHENPEVMPA